MSRMSNEELGVDILPSPDADWGEIGWFALSFDGYEYWGGFDACGDVAVNCREAFLAGKGLSDNLTVLRTSLFFEQRSWRHYGYAPDEAAMIYIHARVEGVRVKVLAGEFE